MTGVAQLFNYYPNAIPIWQFGRVVNSTNAIYYNLLQSKMLKKYSIYTHIYWTMLNNLQSPQLFTRAILLRSVNGSTVQ